MNNLTEWWLSKGVSDNKLKLLNTPAPEFEPDYDNYWQYKANRFLSYIPYHDNIKDYNLKIYYNASKFIEWLFFTNVDADTLIVTSNVEHENVDKTMKSINRYGKEDHVILDWNNDIQTTNISKVIQACLKKQYKKVFVYIIGTQISTGEVAPQAVYEKIQTFCKNNNLECVTVIDDVHGMFLVPRDYSIFDHIIGTAHALIRKFDMGIIISKDKFDYGFESPEFLQEYLDRLDILLYDIQQLTQLQTFSHVMQEEFREFIDNDKVSYKSNSVSHIFSLQVNVPPKFIFTEKEWEELSNLEVRLEHSDLKTDNMFYIRMRAAQYITFPELLEPAVDKVKEILQRVKDYE